MIVGNSADGNRPTTDTGKIVGKRYRNSKPLIPDLNDSERTERSSWISSVPRKEDRQSLLGLPLECRLRLVPGSQTMGRPLSPSRAPLEGYLIAKDYCSQYASRPRKQKPLASPHPQPVHARTRQSQPHHNPPSKITPDGYGSGAQVADSNVSDE